MGGEDPSVLSFQLKTAFHVPEMGWGCPTAISEKSELVKVIVPWKPPEPMFELGLKLPLHWPCPTKFAVPHQNQ